jgi:uncharacterized protein
MKYFLLRLNAPRTTFAQDMTAGEGELMSRHGAYWRDFADKGFAIAFGPVADPKGAWGVGLVEVEDEALVHEFAANDPVIKANAGFSYDILSMPLLALRKGL